MGRNELDSNLSTKPRAASPTVDLFKLRGFRGQAVKRLALCGLLVLASAVSFAQSVREWSQGFVYNPVTKQAEAAVGTEVGKLSALFGRPSLSLDVVSFVSSSWSGSPSIGYAALANFKVANELAVRLGPGVVVAQGSKPVCTLACFVSFRF